MLIMSFIMTESDNVGDCLTCCKKCKGLFLLQEAHRAHVQECTGSPYKSPCQLFACERKHFLQVIQSLTLQKTGQNVHNFSQEPIQSDMNNCCSVEQQTEMEKVCSFIPDMQPESSKTCSYVSMSDCQTDLVKECPFVSATQLTLGKGCSYISEQQIGLGKECSYIGHSHLGTSKSCDFIDSSQTGLDKNCPFTPDSNSALGKDCSFVPDLNSEHRKDGGFVPDPNRGLGKVGSFASFSQANILDKECSYVSDSDLPILQNLVSPPNLPSLSSSYPCITSEFLGSSTITQDDSGGQLLSNVEECRQLQYLDLAQKDPFLCQGQLTQTNSKDPFLINATVKLPVLKNPTKSCEDLQTSPTFQDSSLFTFPSSNLDEPTQLDYLDLATIDLYMGNSTLGNSIFKPLERVPLDKEGNYNADELDQSYPLVGTSVGLSGDHVYETFSDTLSSQLIDSSVSRSVEEKVNKKRKPKTPVFRKRRKSEGGNVVKKRPKLTYKQKILNVKEQLVHLKEEERKDYVTVLDVDGKLAVKKVKPDKKATNKPIILDDNTKFSVEKIADRLLHKCKECNYKSYYRSNMDRHQSVHRDKMTQTCPYCDFATCEDVLLKTHMERHERQNLCYLCGERFSDRSMLTNHLTKQHTGKYKYRCPDCEYCTNLKSGFEDHQRKHAGCFLHCDYEDCDFKTIYRRVLNQHKQKHEGVKKHSCDQCEFITGDVGILKKHMAASHQNDKNFKCPHCAYLCVTRYGVVQHIRSKHFKLKQYKCDQCDYRTGYSSGLRFHLMAHAGIKPFKCSACDYHSSAVAKVTRHMKKMHADVEDVSVEKLDLPFQLDAKRFKCDDNVMVDASEIDVIELTEEEKKQLVNQSAGKGKANKKVNPVFKTSVNSNAKTNVSISTNTSASVNINLNGNGNAVNNLNGHHSQSEYIQNMLSVGSCGFVSPDSVGEIVVVQSDPDLESMISSIKMPGPSGTLSDFVLAYQCRRCLLLYTKEVDLYAHIQDCKSTPISDIVDVQL